MVKGLEFCIVPAGHIENDAAWNFMGYGFGTADDHNRKEAWFEIPMFFVAVRHPEAGYFLYDTGCGLREEIDRRPASHRQMNPSFIKREEFVDERLKQLGIPYDDLAAIVISHCHWDHIGGLEFFADTKSIQHTYVPEKDYTYGLVATHRSACGYTDNVYYKNNIDISGAEFQLVNEDMELFPGVELIMLEGHCPNVLGLMLHTEAGTYIFPSDAVTADIGLRDPIVRPGCVYDSLGYDRTVEKLRRLEKKYDAKFIFSHDPWNYPTYPKMEWIGAK